MGFFESFMDALLTDNAPGVPGGNYMAQNLWQTGDNSFFGVCMQDAINMEIYQQWLESQGIENSIFK